MSIAAVRYRRVERRHQRLPGRPVVGKAVDQHHQRSLALDHVVDLHRPVPGVAILRLGDSRPGQDQHRRREDHGRQDHLAHLEDLRPGGPYHRLGRQREGVKTHVRRWPASRGRPSAMRQRSRYGAVRTLPASCGEIRTGPRFGRRKPQCLVKSSGRDRPPRRPRRRPRRRQDRPTTAPPPPRRRGLLFGGGVAGRQPQSPQPARRSGDRLAHGLFSVGMTARQTKWPRLRFRGNRAKSGP